MAPSDSTTESPLAVAKQMDHTSALPEETDTPPEGLDALKDVTEESKKAPETVTYKGKENINVDRSEEERQSKKRHRPASLNLKNTTNLLVGNNQSKENLENFVLRLVSPGLPPLNAKMKSTVMISKSIEMQQKQLIAQRNGSRPSSTTSIHAKSGIFENGSNENSCNNNQNGDANDSNNKDMNIEDNNENNNNISNDKKNQSERYSTIQESNGDTGLTGTLNRFNIPSSKRLKRSNIPKALNIDENDIKFNPLIKSAPIRPNNYFSPFRHNANPVLQQRQILQQNFPVQYARFMNQQQYPLHFASNTRNLNSNFRPYLTPNTAVPYKRFRGLKTPYAHQFSSRTLQNPEMQLHSPHLSATMKTLKKSTVTDVFHGDFAKAAPIQAQPLSAQKELFGLNYDKINDRTPVSKEEAAEMEIIYKRGLNQKSKSHSPSSLAPKSDPIQEDNEIEDDDDDDVEGKAIDDEDNIQLSDLIMKNQLETQRSKTIMGSIHIMNEYFKFEIFKSNNEFKDKSEFLRLCENAWDKSVDSI